MMEIREMQANDAMLPVPSNTEVPLEIDEETQTQTQELEEVRGVPEIQAMPESSLNCVFPGLPGQQRYVGDSLGDTPLTNVNNGDLLGDHDLPAHQQLQVVHNHSPGEVLFPLRLPRETDQNNLIQQELKLIHQAEEQHVFYPSMEQQQNQLSFRQPEYQHQQLVSHESGMTGPFYGESPRGREDRNFSSVVIDHNGANFLTAWEESVKYLENLRQSQEQQRQQQTHQSARDQFCLNNVPLGRWGGYAEGQLDPDVHQQNNSSRERCPSGSIANKEQSDIYSPPHPSRTSISTSNPCPVLGFPGTTIPGHSPDSLNKGPTGPVNSCHSPGANPFSCYPLIGRTSSSHLLSVSDINLPGIPYLGLGNRSVSFNSRCVPENDSGLFSKFTSTYNPALSGGTGGHFPLDLPGKHAHMVDQDLHVDYGHRNQFGNVSGSSTATSGHFILDMPFPKRVKSAVGKLLGDLEPKPLHHFATERQRREHLNEKYQILRSLVPNPTKADRASIVSDAINRIHELKKQEETLMAEKNDRQRRKQLMQEIRTGIKRPRLQLDPDGDNTDQQGADDNDISLKTQWIKKVSEHGTEVQVRIFCNEVELDIKQTHKPRFLLRVMTAIEVGLKLQILDGNGGMIRNWDVYRFKLKMKKESCTVIGLMATKLLEILDAVF